VASEQCDLLCLDLLLAEELRARRLDEASAREASSRYQAFGDPTRLNIALALGGAQELCVCDLAWIVERAQNLVSRRWRCIPSPIKVVRFSNS
jgi:DNA-binding transcriptional ArsR family regulator